MSLPCFSALFAVMVFFLGLTSNPLLAESNVREIVTMVIQRGTGPDVQDETMEFELFQDVSPHAVANLKYLAETRFYDNTAFHRLVPGFMVQGGCPNTRNDTNRSKAPAYGQGGPEYTIPDEPTSNSDRKHARGVLSMAKTGAPNSGGSQFFVMFSDAPWLDGVRVEKDENNFETTFIGHAPMGRLISGTATLDALEKEQVGPNSSGEISIPQRLLTLRSIRVRSEYLGAPPSGALAFQPGTFGGPLRGVDRNFELKGTYRVTLSKTGMLSGQVQYFGRTNTFAGKLTRTDSSQPRAAFTSLLNPTSPAPLRVRVHARNTPAGKTALSIIVCGITPGGADQEDETLAVGAGELVPAIELTERHTIVFEPPRLTSGTSTVLAADNMAGFGFLTLKAQSLTGAATGSGLLPDGRSISFNTFLTKEGHRNILPVHFHELPTGFTKSFTTTKIPLADWSAKHLPDTSKETPDFSSLAFRLNGCLQLPTKSGAYVTSPPNYLRWYREPKTSGTIKSAITGTVYPVMRQWTPPSGANVLPPFSASRKGSIGGAQFQISPTNTAALFTPANAAAIQLKFTPLDGTFRGWILHQNSRKPFQGILLKSVAANDLNGGFGYVVLAEGTYPVSVYPVSDSAP